MMMMMITQFVLFKRFNILYVHEFHCLVMQVVWMNLFRFRSTFSSRSCDDWLMWLVLQLFLMSVVGSRQASALSSVWLQPTSTRRPRPTVTSPMTSIPPEVVRRRVGTARRRSAVCGVETDCDRVCLLSALWTSLWNVRWVRTMRYVQCIQYVKTPSVVMLSVDSEALVTVTVLTRCSAIAERPRCRVRYSFRQKWKTGTGRQYFTDIIGLSSTTVT